MNDFGRDLHNVRPHVSRFIYRMAQDYAVTEDVVSEAILKAWQHRDRFQAGTSLKAWVCFIARNQLLSAFRRRRWDGGSVDELLGNAMPSAPAPQGAAVDLADALKAIQELSRDQREAVLLVGAGATYEEAAEDLCCSVGTIKSRVARGRDGLRELLA